MGKSSVLAAGLLPRLEGSHPVRYCRRDQARGLAGTLADALGAADAGEPGRRLAQRRGGSRQAAPGHPGPGRGALHPAQPDAARRAGRFLDCLAGLFADPARRPQGRLILGFRKEWLAEIEKRLEERRLPRAKVFLERLGRRGHRRGGEGPARAPRLRDHYGLTVAAEPARPDRRRPAGRPRVARGAHAADPARRACGRRPRQRDYDHPTFDQALYDELRAQGLGLDDFLTRQLEALRGRQAPAVESGLALDLLAYHTTPLGTAEQRTMTELEQTYRHQAEALPGLVQECRDLYLLVDPSQNQPDQPAASRLTHDTLAPHVRKRFDESDAPGQRARRILESRAVDWEEGKEGTPLDDADLAMVEAGRPGCAPGMTPRCAWWR